MTPRAAFRLAAVLRCVIALVLVATSLGKLLDLAGFAAVLRSYEALPGSVIGPMAAAVPLAELVLAAWLLSGRRLPVASLVSVALHLLYAAWAAIGILRGLRLANCGCFGVFFARPLTWRTVLEDGVMAALSAGLFLAAMRSRMRIAA